MSLPAPIIPQTPEQARQRDVLAGLKPVTVTDPRVELERLRLAVREHQVEMTAAGPLGMAKDFSELQNAIMDRKHAADRKLWAAAGVETPEGS